ncbi:hypothetical protein [Candidatus Cytomitobacter primus]|uniref:Uncharacterized protein n=1 Tax=Candidatus Cytomitobacter primus TaxID=2066024 RepID=A0A5C0UF99_9PROT|nr:hypothetical protein [Candidatus Cytomitobacter primus]QEK38390.1 hypothetical protein FZC34_00445 [Candidatus Cytomitobacter primus]
MILFALIMIVQIAYTSLNSYATSNHRKPNHGNFICITNFMSKNIKKQVKILDTIPKPWTFVNISSKKIVIYIPAERNHEDFMEILTTYGFECWSTYA